MLKRKTIIVCLIFSLFLELVPLASVQAITRRSLPGKTTRLTTTTSSVGTSVRLRSDRRAVIVTFSHLNLAESVTYVLVYESKGKSEGSQGSIRPAGEIATSRELLFGTCSSGVCTYHTNIRNARLTVIVKLKNAKTIRKSYRIRV